MTATQTASGSAPASALHSPGIQHACAILIALGAVAARLYVMQRTHATGEDALITLRYAQNIARGHGFTYNPGEYVLGVTTPLYCLMLALFDALHRDAMEMGKLCCVVADGLTCYLIARLTARPEIDRPVEGLFAAALYALTSTPINVSTSGMETALVTCVGMVMVTCCVAGRVYWMCGLGAILYLLRIDGLVLFVALGITHAIRTKSVPVKPIGLFAAIALPWTIYAWVRFGSPIPTSVIAKLTVYRHASFAPPTRWHITPGNLDAFAAQFAGGPVQKALTFLFVPGVILVTWKALTRQSMGVLAGPALWCLAYYGVMLVGKVPAFGWYFLPPWPIYLCIACIAGGTAPAALRKLAKPRDSGWDRAAAPLALLLVLMAGAAHFPRIVRDIAEAQRLEDDLRKPVGLYLKENVRAGERVMLEPIGYIGYYSEARILDSIGLVSPEVLASYDPGVVSPTADIISRLHPEWLCLRESEAEALQKAPNFDLERQYEFVSALSSQSARFLIFRIVKDKPLDTTHLAPKSHTTHGDSTLNTGESGD